MAKKPIYDPEKIWFSSDWHLSHNNILKFDNRPFNTIEEHDDAIIKNINDTIPADGILFFLGDFTFKDWKQAVEFRERINCQIAFVTGNHDLFFEKMPANEQQRHFLFVKPLTTIKVKDETLKDGFRRVVLCHYPIYSWNHKYRMSYMIHGHTHHNLKPMYTNTFIAEKLKTAEGIEELKVLMQEKTSPFGLMLDVGCNGHNYMPLSWKEIQAIMNTKIFQAVDHHAGDI